MDITYESIKITVGRATGRTGLVRDTLRDWLAPAGDGARARYAGIFARSVAQTTQAVGLPFDLDRAKSDKVEAEAAFEAWLDLDESFIAEWYDASFIVAAPSDPVTGPEALPKDADPKA